MVWRKTVALRMAVQVGGADGFGFTDNVTKQPVAPGQIADPLARCVVQPRRDELDETGMVRAKDAERRISRTHDVARGIHDHLQYLVELVVREDRHAGCEQPLEPVPDAGRFRVRGHGRHNASRSAQ